MGKSAVLLGLSLPLAALVTAWAALDPEQESSFWGVPVKAKTIALVWVLLIYFQFGLAYGDPIFALFSLAAPAAAFFYVRKLPRLNLDLRTARDWRPRREMPSGPLLRTETEERERVGGFNPLRKRQEQIEIERLRKLLGEDDDGVGNRGR